MLVKEEMKVSSEHLKRDAYLYVRQSTMRQVVENRESTKRQYALVDRAVGLGWLKEQINIIDSDQAQSAAIGDREGFKRLVAEVGMGHAGLVMGIEVSRLARNCGDWHRLLDICGLTGTLILDEDGIYDPRNFNDRLLMGMKGTISEAEHYMIRQRLLGGMMNKAQRGELKIRLPVGLVYGANDKVVLDPDSQVRQSVRQFFDAFRQTGSAFATALHFNREGWLFPRRIQAGPDKGALVWEKLRYGRVLENLRNPRYAGAYAYGRRTQRIIMGKVSSQHLPRDKWPVLIIDAHPGYISWNQYQENIRIMSRNAYASKGSRKSPPREGPALLQGLAVCGNCGSRMTVRYHHSEGITKPEYNCKGSGFEPGESVCQNVIGDGIDNAVGDLLVSVMTPAALEVSLAVQKELKRRIEEADRLRYKQVERANYESDLARRRYMNIDPENRLVAASLEAEWNGKLKALREAEEEYQRRTQEDRLSITEDQKAKIVSLAVDFPRLWKNKKTAHRERKRIARLLLEDVTISRKDVITLGVRFKGGATRTITLPLPQTSFQSWTTPPEVVAAIDRLLSQHTTSEIALILNQQGILSGQGKSFDEKRVNRIRRAYNLKSRFARLREHGMLTTKELVKKLRVHRVTIARWREQGKLKAHCYEDHDKFLYEKPDFRRLKRAKGKRPSKKAISANVSRQAKEV